MYVIATSLVCSVGLNAVSACAAMRAGIAGFTELPYLDNEGETVVGATVLGVDHGLKRGTRVASLLAKTLLDLFERNARLVTERIPLLVGLADPGRPGGVGNLTGKIIHSVEQTIGKRFHSLFSQEIPSGHISVFEGLRLARRLLQNPNISACIVVGADSCINASTLNWLEQQGRLKTPTNSNGLIPGEAAGALLIQKEPPKPGVAVRIAGLGFAMEKAHVLSEEPFLGIGLVEATRQALTEASRSFNEVDFRLSDATGESYGFKEQALLLSRLMRARRAQFPLWHCADAIGDTGAAAGVCHLVRAAEAFAKGYAPGANGASFASNLSGERAAAILQYYSS